MVLQAGSRIGAYEIIAPLGAGGMGEVYRARDTRLDRTVAIKVLPASLAADPQFRERFDREARAISQLDHPHICALYDVGRAGWHRVSRHAVSGRRDARRSADEEARCRSIRRSSTRSRSPTRSTERIAPASSIAM